MLPKKGRKEITVDGVLYHYMVKDHTRVTIRNNETGEIIKWYEDHKPKWNVQIKPSDIAQIIRIENPGLMPKLQRKQK